MRRCVKVTILLLLLTANAWPQEPSLIKKTNVAGSFYEADPQILAGHIDQLLAAAQVEPVAEVPMMIVPHAGYVFSGPVAAHGFKAVAAHHYASVIILAPSHFYPFGGAAIWSKGAFETPLGNLSVDETLAAQLLKQTPVIKEEPKAFEREHAVEVELPFIERVLGQVKIVPIVLGEPNINDAKAVAEALDAVLGQRRDVLVLISSDMSHYHPYQEAVAMDQRTLQAIIAGDVPGFWQGIYNGRMEMCGFMPVTVGMLLAKQRGLSQVKVLTYANSGDTTGDKSKVVGYSAVLFGTGDGQFNRQDRNALLKLARQSVTNFVTGAGQVKISDDLKRFAQAQGAFVTLTKQGQLRGCVGNIMAEKPLVETVRDMAVAAASQDPRFKPVTSQELSQLRIEISVLSPVKRIQDAGAIVLGRDGVIISDGKGHQGIFLPQVAQETGWSKEEFLRELCVQKAGLPADAWKDPDVSLYTFTAEVFGEE